MSEALTVYAGMELIHYGSEKFDLEAFCPIADDHFIKPEGGLWGCPVSSDHDWAGWCRGEDFRIAHLERSFRFRFVGQLLIIDGAEDLAKLPWVCPMRGWYFPVFQPLLLMGVDAVYLTARGEIETRHTTPRSLYGWDCESVLVLNPKTILPIIEPLCPTLGIV